MVGESGIYEKSYSKRSRSSGVRQELQASELRTHGGRRDARSLSSDGRRLLDVLESLCAAGRPHHGLSCAVC